jgi:hypothetical protein
MNRLQNKTAALLAALLLMAPLLASAQTAPAQAPKPAPQVPAGIAKALSPSSPIKIITSLDKAVIRVGDLVHYSLSIEAPPGSKIMMPPPGAQLGEFLIRDYSFPDLEPKKTSWFDRAEGWLSARTGMRIAGKQSKGQQFNFTITAYDTGDLMIPPLPVVIVDPAGEAHSLRAESARVRVAPVTNPEDLTIRDVKAPVAIAFPVTKYLPWLLLPVALLAAAILSWWYLRRRRREEVELIPLRPAHEIALEELAALEQDGLLEKGEQEKYYTRLSWIMRKYVALRFAVYAFEYTTTEIMERLKRQEIEHGDFDKLRLLLEEADRVKFARYAPTLSERNTAMARCRELVENTREKPPAEPAKEAA